MEREYSFAQVLPFPEAGFVPLPASPGAPPRTSRWRIPPQSRCFEGHFAGDPILPGVAHVALALSACAREAGDPQLVKGLQDLRLKIPLRPGDEVDVVLAAGREPLSVRFEIRRDGEPASTGLLLFTGAAEPAHG